jgi:hypothetical protein
MKVGQIPVHIDLGAEKVIGAERNGEKIAIEIKTFGLASFITALYDNGSLKIKLQFYLIDIVF